MAGRGYSRGDFTAYKSGEHVVIHAVADGKGGPICSDGSALPNLRQGASVQLRFLAAQVKGSAERAALSAPELNLLLAQETVLFAIVGLRALEEPALRGLLSDRGLVATAQDARNLARQVTPGRPRPLPPYFVVARTRLLNLSVPCPQTS